MANSIGEGDLEEIGRDVSELIDELAGMADAIFTGAVERGGLVLTGELKQSVEADVKASLNTWGGEIDVFFKDYWRYKDMKQYEYSSGAFINVDAIRAFVKKLGVGSFRYVNGYNDATSISDEKKIDRIVRSIVFYRRKMPVVKNNRKDRKRLYNKTKVAYMNLLRKRIMGLLGVKVLIGFKESME
ncbi:MAG TPA: hypothetical protein VK175_06400 [Leadbetterella sp.]|nr:hypothetical protein [Leadbetterella sp.]